MKQQGQRNYHLPKELKFSMSALKEMYKEQYEDNAY